MPDSLKKEIGQGARVNALGVLGKLAGPAFFVLVIRLYGPDNFGVYVTALALVEMALALLIAGFKDGAVIFVARYADEDRSNPRLYRALANALTWSLVLSVLLVLAALTLGPRFLPELYPDFGSELAAMVSLMALALPILAFERVVISATQGLKIMKYEVIVNGMMRPLLLIAFASAAYGLLPDYRGLAAAYLATQVLIGLYTVFVFHRELVWRHLLRAFRDFEIDTEMITFALPQNINALFTRFVTNIDILMLGMFGLSAGTTGLYAAGAMIVRELRQIKLVFSTSFAPHISKLFENKELDKLAHLFSTTVRWTTSLMIPAVLIVAALRNDLLSIAHPDFADGSALFMIALPPIPLLQGSLGFAGNVVVMSGFSRLNLYNSLAATTLNVVLNLFLIPLFGMAGAAIASTISAALKTGVEFIQMRSILRIRPNFGEYFGPLAAGVPAAALMAAFLIFSWIPSDVLMGRAAITLIAVTVFAGLLAFFVGGTPWKSQPSAHR